MDDEKDYLKEVKDIVSKDKREILLLTTKASVNGAVTGLVIGMMFVFTSKKVFMFLD